MSKRLPAPALLRGIHLLRILEREGAVSLETLARATGWPKSSVLRCLQGLEDCGLIRRSRENKTYRALHRLVPVYAHFPQSLRGVAESLPLWAARYGRVAELFADTGEGLVLIDRAEPTGWEGSLRARIGFTRMGDELEATALLHLALRMPAEAEGSEGVHGSFWRWDGDGKSRFLDRNEVARLLHEARRSRVAYDPFFNENDIRRYARALVGERGMVGVLAFAEGWGGLNQAADQEFLRALQALRLPPEVCYPVS